jgi:hypothetical protein
MQHVERCQPAVVRHIRHAVRYSTWSKCSAEFCLEVGRFKSSGTNITFVTTQHDAGGKDGDRGVAPLIHNLGARWGWVGNAMPQLVYPRERPGTRYRYRTVGWTPEPSARIWHRENLLPPLGFEHRTAQRVAARYTVYCSPVSRN